MDIVGLVWKLNKITKEIQEKENQHYTKDDKSPVTIADFTVQTLIHDLVRKAYPQDKIISEENSKVVLENEELLDKIYYYVKKVAPEIEKDEIPELLDYRGIPGAKDSWILDPIDGTKGFLRGKQFAIALAKREGSEITMGMLGCPNLFSRGSLFLAEKGLGAWSMDPVAQNLNRIKADSFSDLTRLQLCESVEAAHSSSDFSEKLLKSIKSEVTPLKVDSQCKYALVASRNADLYLRVPTSERKEKIWDHAAGYILVKEAGGKVTDLNGKELDFSFDEKLENNEGIIASSAAIYSNVMNIVRQLRLQKD